MHTRVIVVAGLALALGAGCSSGPAQGEERGACYPNGTCNTGLSCLSNVCVVAGADAGMDAGNDAGMDASADMGADANVPDTSMPNDAADAADVVDAAPAWQPTALGSALSLWLEANVGVTASAGHVATWADQSGNHNDATPSASLTPPAVGAVGSRAVIQFVPSSAALQIADNASLQFPADFAVEIVVGSSATGYEFLYSKVGTSMGPNGMELEFGEIPTLFINNPYILTGSVSGGLTNLKDGALHILGVRRTGTGCDVRIDGVSNPGGVSQTSCSILVNGAGAPVTIGRSYDLGLGSTEDVAEIVAIRGTVSDADMMQLETDFRAKYGL